MVSQLLKLWPDILPSRPDKPKAHFTSRKSILNIASPSRLKRILDDASDYFKKNPVGCIGRMESDNKEAAALAAIQAYGEHEIKESLEGGEGQTGGSAQGKGRYPLLGEVASRGWKRTLLRRRQSPRTIGARKENLSKKGGDTNGAAKEVNSRAERPRHR